MIAAFLHRMGEDRFWEPAPAEGGEGSAQCSEGPRSGSQVSCWSPLALCAFGQTNVPSFLDLRFLLGRGRLELGEFFLFSSAEMLPVYGSFWTEAHALEAFGRALCVEVGVLRVIRHLLGLWPGSSRPALPADTAPPGSPVSWNRAEATAGQNLSLGPSDSGGMRWQDWSQAGAEHSYWPPPWPFSGNGVGGRDVLRVGVQRHRE